MHDILDYAIVGAGPSGSYIAWRLARADSKSNIQLYEATPRSGGRLNSARMPQITRKAELGGMRYAASHIIVQSLVRELGLTAERFDYEQKAMRLRGKYFLVPPDGVLFPSTGSDAPPYLVEGEEQGKKPGELISFALGEALRELTWARGAQDECPAVVEKWNKWKSDNKKLTYDAFEPVEWDYVGRYGVLKGSALWDLGFWNVLQHYLSIEAFLFAHDGLGYESVLANWNAAEAIPWFLKDFATNDYFTVTDGMQAIPKTLCAEFRHLAHNDVRFRYTLEAIEKGEHSFRLRFWNGERNEYAVVFARKVVLAMPKHALMSIKFRGFSDSAEEFGFSDDGDHIQGLDSVTSHSMAKLFLGYDEAWWAKPDFFGSNKGKLTVDSPLRQVYFFGPDEKESAKTPSLVMAGYSDSHYVDFWKPLYPRGLNWDPFYTGDQSLMTDELRKFFDAFAVGQNVINKAIRFMQRLFPGKIIPDPYMGFLVTWDGPPYYGGWHTWNCHQEPWILRRQIMQPFKNAQMFICGEAYSCEQGWVEGALRSAEMVLNELGIEEPDFVDPESYRDHHFLGGYLEYIDQQKKEVKA